MITLRHLQIFVAVVEHGTMHAAAESLYISQPSVSQGIKEIEQHYGIMLFERISKKLYITEVGNELLSYARHILSTYNEMDLAISHSGSGKSLRIGATVTVGGCIIMPIVKDFENQMSGVSAKVTVDNTSVIERMILTSQLDVAIVEGKIQSKDIIKIPVYSDKLVLVTSINHPLTKMKHVKLKDIINYEFIVRERGSHGRELFLNHVKRHGLDINVKWSCTNVETIKKAVMSGEGIAVISSLTVGDEISNNKIAIIPVEDFNITRDICLVYHKDKYVSKMLDKFIECSKNIR